MIVERTRVPATLEMTICAGVGNLANCAASVGDFLQQHVPGFEPVLARFAAGTGAEQSPFEERVADVDQQIVVGLAGERSSRSFVLVGPQIGSSGKIGRVSLR